MRIGIVTHAECSDARVEALKKYFDEKYPQAETLIFAGDFLHIGKKTIENRKTDRIYVHTKPYYKNLSFGRISSHLKLSKDIIKKISAIGKFDLLWILVPLNSLVKESAKYKKKHPETKLVFDIIDCWPESLPIKISPKVFPLNIWKNMRDKYINAADAVALECALYKKVLDGKVNENKLKTLYLAGEDPWDMEFLRNKDEASLCYLGSINNIIDIEGIGKVVKDIAKRRKTTAHIIGDGEKKEQLCEALKAAGAEVVCYGAVFDEKEKIKIFSRCSYGINMMKKDVCVGLTMKSMDYFRASLPVINSISGDTESFVRQYKLGVNIKHENEISFDEEKLNEMNKNVRSFYENNLTIKHFNNTLDEIMQNIF